MAREKNLEKLKAAKGSQLETNKKAMNIQVSTSTAPSMLVVQFSEKYMLGGPQALYDVQRINGPLTPVYALWPFCLLQFKGRRMLNGSRLCVTDKNEIQCKVCMQTFMCTTSEVKCRG